MNRSVLARQMFANGGQAVPNEYKGFSRLPEQVQMKMDPVAAKKYQEGGSVNYNEGFPRDPIMDRALALETSREFGLDPREYSQMMRDPEFLAEARSMNMTPEELRRQQIQMMPGQRQGSLQAEADRMGITLRELLALMASPPFAPSGNMAGPEATMMRPNETYSEVKPMAMGGDPAMAQGVGSMMPPPPAMPPAQPPMEGGQAMDPQVLEGLLNEASQSIGDLDQAEDYETVINSIRGDDAPISARYEELASVVGEEDAAQTPESVLALTQPAIMMGAVDQGIGGLAAEEMTEPVQGAMAQGIMSNVAPPPPPAAPMPPAGMGGPPPVNFNQGGLVRRGDNQPVLKFAQAGVVPGPFANVPGDLGKLARERMAAREGLIGDPAGRLQEQKDLTKSQMLFDIANTALAFAAPMEGERAGMSAAERLAMAARTTQLPQTIGARAAQLGEFKTGLAKEKQALQLAALGSAETALAAQQAADAQAARDKAKFAQEEKIEGIRAANSISETVLKGQQAYELAGYRGDLESTLAQSKGLIEEGLIKLRNNKSMEADAKRIELQGLQDRTNILLRGTQALEELELKQLGAIAQIDQKHLKQLAIQENQTELTREMKQIDREMKSVDQSIAMAGQDLEEAKMIDRAAAEANKNALEQKRIDLEERKVKVKEAAAGLNLFGKGTEGAILGIVSDNDLLTRYGDGKTTAQESNTVELAINEFTKSKDSINPDTGIIETKPGGTLIEAAQNAIKKRAGLSGAPLSLPKIASVLTSPETVMRRINTPEFNQSLFSAETGSVDLKSESWESIPTTIVDNNIRYEAATGLPSFVQRAANYFSEGAREFGIGSGLSAAGKNVSQADADLDVLRNRALLEITNLSDDRILKVVTVSIANELDAIEGSAFRTDERIYAKLGALEKGLARQLQNLANIVPEYGGVGRGYSGETVQKARASANNIRGLIAEVQGFKNVYEKALNVGSLGLNNAQRAKARDALKARQEKR